MNELAAVEKTARMWAEIYRDIKVTSNSSDRISKILM